MMVLWKCDLCQPYYRSESQNFCD